MPDLPPPDCSGVSYCSGNGDCVDTDTCSCYGDWTGPDCSIEDLPPGPDCAGVSYCSDNGDCVDNDICSCYGGWGGADCSTPDVPPLACDYYLGQTNITAVLGTPNTVYCLNESVTSTTANAISVSAANVTINCLGNLITGIDAGSYNGIITDQLNTTVRNCDIRDFGTGVYFNTGSDNGLIDLTNVSGGNNGMMVFANNMTISNSIANGTNLGIYMEFGSYGTIINSTGISTSDTTNGIEIRGDYAIVSNCTGIGTNTGIMIMRGSYCSISGSRGEASERSGIDIGEGIGNNITNSVGIGAYYGLYFGANESIIANNTLSSPVIELFASGSGNSFFWNNFTDTIGLYISDFSSGLNAYNGSVVGIDEGNIYAHVLDGTANIASDPSTVSNFGADWYVGNNGANYPYNETTSYEGPILGSKLIGMTDYAPLIPYQSCEPIINLTQASMPATLYCQGSAYVLQENLTNIEGSLLTVGADNVTIDCNGYWLIGSRTEGEKGIYSNGYNELTIRNCNLMDFGTADGTSCPFVYSWNGTDYIFDNEDLTVAAAPWWEADYGVRLPSLVSDEGRYKIKVSEVLPETDYIDRMDLIAVDHPSGTVAYNDVNGNYYAISDPQLPLSCINEYGEDCLSTIASKDGDRWNWALDARKSRADLNGDGYADSTDPADYFSWIELEFDRKGDQAQLIWDPQVNGKVMDRYYWLLLNQLGANNIESFMTESMQNGLYGYSALDKVDTIYLWNGTDWQFVHFGSEMFAAHKAPEMVVPINLSGINTPTFKIRIKSISSAGGPDYIKADFSEQAPFEQILLYPTSAVCHKKDGNAINALSIFASDDSNYTILETDEYCELEYNSPSPALEERTVFTKSNGFYTPKMTITTKHEMTPARKAFIINLWQNGLLQLRLLSPSLYPNAVDSHSAIHIANGANNRIEDTNITNSVLIYEDGIAFENVSDSVINRSDISYVGTESDFDPYMNLIHYVAAIRLNNSDNNTIENVYVHDSRVGIELADSAGNTIANSNLSGIGNTGYVAGIYLNNATSTNVNGVVMNFTYLEDDGYSDGIFVYATQNASLVGNTIEINADALDGPSISGIKILDNEDPYLSNYNVFENNTIRLVGSSGPAINMEYSEAAENTFLNNRIYANYWVLSNSQINYFNDSAMGNKYYFEDGTPSWEVYNISDTDGGGWADEGSDLPFGSLLAAPIIISNQTQHGGDNGYSQSGGLWIDDDVTPIIDNNWSTGNNPLGSTANIELPYVAPSNPINLTLRVGTDLGVSEFSVPSIYFLTGGMRLVSYTETPSYINVTFYDDDVSAYVQVGVIEGTSQLNEVEFYWVYNNGVAPWTGDAQDYRPYAGLIAPENITLDWHAFYGADTADRAYATTFDLSENEYIVGRSKSSWNGPGDVAPLHAHADSGTAADLFVLKLDRHGNYLWHTFYGTSGSADSVDYAYGVAIDAGGNAYVTGFSYGTWNGDNGTAPLNNFTGEEDYSSNAFVLKLDENGAYQWHTFHGSGEADGEGSADEGRGIAVDANSNAYVSMVSRATWDGPGEIGPLHAFTEGFGDPDIAVLKLDENGTYVWHTFYGAEYSSDEANSIALDENANVYVAGVSASSWIGSDNEEPIHAYSSGNDIVILKLDEIGNYQWHTFHGSSAEDADSDSGQSIATDSSNNAYVAGNSHSNWLGDGDAEPLHAYSGDGSTTDIAMLKLDADGTYQWHTFYGSADADDYANGIAVDNESNAYVVGRSEATWNGFGSVSPSHAYSGGTDIALLKLESNGTYKWHTFYGSESNDRGQAISVDQHGNLFATGYSDATWDGEDGAPLNAHAGGDDAVGFYIYNYYPNASCVDLADESTWGEKVSYATDCYINNYMSSYEGACYLIESSTTFCNAQTVDAPLIIDNPDVTLDCNGYSLTGTNQTNAIYSEMNGTAVKNCIIQNFTFGVSYYDIENSSVENTSINLTGLPACQGDYSSYCFGMTLIYVRNSNFTGISLNTVSSDPEDPGTYAPIVAQIIVNDSFANISGLSSTSLGMYFIGGESNTFENITSVSTYGSEMDFMPYGTLAFGSMPGTTIENATVVSQYAGLLISESQNTTISNSISTGVAQDIILDDSICDGGSIVNVNGSNGLPVLFYNEESQNLEGVNASAIVLCGANFSTVANSRVENSGILLYGTSYANLTWNNITANVGNALSDYAGTGNQFRSNALFADNDECGEWRDCPYAFYAYESTEGLFLNNTIYASYWVNDEDSDIAFNNSTSGNAYYFANGTGAWEIYNAFDRNNDSWADVGTDLPFGPMLAGSEWSGNSGDYHPYTENELVCLPEMNISTLPSALYCPNSIYRMQGNLTTDGYGTAITVEAENVTIDCGGFRVYGSFTSDGILSDYSGTHITNCDLRSFAVYSIQLEQSSQNSIENTFADDGAYGIKMYYVNDSVIRNSTGLGIGDPGIYLHGCNRINITNSTALNGFGLDSSSDIMFENCTATSNESDAMYAYNSPRISMTGCNLTTTVESASALNMYDDGAEMRTDNGTFERSIFNSTGFGGTALKLQGELVGGNVFLNNTFQAEWWVASYSEDENYFNNSEMGNKYYFVNGTPSWEVYDISSSTNGSWADEGSDLPFNSSLAAPGFLLNTTVYEYGFDYSANWDDSDLLFDQDWGTGAYPTGESDYVVFVYYAPDNTINATLIVGSELGVANIAIPAECYEPNGYSETVITSYTGDNANLTVSCNIEGEYVDVPGGTIAGTAVLNESAMTWVYGAPTPWIGDDADWHPYTVNNVSDNESTSDTITLLLNGTAANFSAVYGTTLTVNASSLSNTHRLYLEGIEIQSNYSDILAAGHHNFTANSSGNANYTGASATYFANITRANASVSLATSSWIIENGSNATINCSINNPQSNITLYRNGSLVESAIGANISLSQSLAQGSYNYTCNASASQNYSAAADVSSVLEVMPPNVFGDGSSINTTNSTGLNNVTVTIEGNSSVNGTLQTDVKTVNITNGTLPLFVFEYNFTGSELNFSNVSIEAGTDEDGKAYASISGINSSQISAEGKTLYMYNADTTINGVCVKDEEGAAHASISSTCTGGNETSVRCDGASHSGYVCTYSGTTAIITGLRNSAAIQFSATSGTPAAASTSSNGGGAVGGGTPSSAKQSAIYSVDVGMGKFCNVSISRGLVSGTNKSVLTTTLQNIGGEGCSMTDYVFSDTAPSSFPVGLGAVSFSPTPSAIDGWKATFSFPTFAPGESKVLTYTADTWVKSSLLANFTVYTMTAKKQLPAAAQPTINTTATPTVEEPSVWISRKLPTEQPAATAPSATPTLPSDSNPGIFGLVAMLSAIVIVAGAVFFFALKGRKRKVS